LSQPSYEIKLPLFEGPFDLLLFFIERDELDIYDIPISRVTDDFLSYLLALEQLNIDLAADFINADKSKNALTEKGSRPSRN
jgi:segregation and condensation protein A